MYHKIKNKFIKNLAAFLTKKIYLLNADYIFKNKIYIKSFNFINIWF